MDKTMKKIALILTLFSTNALASGDWQAYVAVGFNSFLTPADQRKYDPMGIYGFVYIPDKHENVEFFLEHQSSIPDVRDNTGGFNLFGLKYKLDL